MSNKIDVTCSNCYFHGAGLCALRCDEACPTFRYNIQASPSPPLPTPYRALSLVELAHEHAVA